MSACCCSSKMCELFGCQQDAADRARLAPYAVPVIPINAPGPAPWRTGPVPAPLTEADVRRIVAEELAKLGGGGITSATKER